MPSNPKVRDDDGRINNGPKIKKEITDDDIQKIEAMAGLGMTIPAIAIVMGVSKATLERYWKADPRIYEAWKRGKESANMQVASTAFRMARSGTNSTMTKYWLNCQAKWKETSSIELTGKNGESLNPESAFANKVSAMSDDELAKFIAARKANSDDE